LGSGLPDPLDFTSNEFANVKTFITHLLRPLLDSPQRFAAEEIPVSVQLGCEIKQIIARYKTRALVMANSFVCWQAPVFACEF
jgi:hypothetical protein